MKKFAKVLMTVGALILPGLVYGNALINESALAVNTTAVIDTVANNYAKISVTAFCSTVTVPAVSLTDGRPSTVAITVTDNNALIALASSNTITISSNAACKNEWIRLNGVYFVNPQDWAVAIDTHNVGFSTQTAQNLANAINGSASSATFTAVRSGSMIYLATKSSGSLLNAYTLTSSTPAALVPGSATFFNGRDAAQLKLANFTLTNGIHWFKGANAAATAQSISSGIVAFTGGLIISTWNGSVVYATSTAIDKNSYVVMSTTQSALTVSSVAYLSNGFGIGNFQNGSASSVDLATDYISAANAYPVGLPVLYSTATGTNIRPLVSQTTYFVTAPTSSKFKLATSRANAINGAAVNFTSFLSTGSVSYVLTPIAYSAGNPASFKWQLSNDAINWFDAPISSVTIYSTAVSTGQAVNVGDANFKYYRTVFTTSDNGASAVKIDVQGK